MNKIYQLMMCLVAGSLLQSCYQDEDISAKLEEPRYTVEQGDHPLDQFIYQYYQDNNSYILYNYDKVDYKWNLTKTLPLELVEQPDKDLLNKGVECLKKTWMDFYTPEFQKQYFPYKILLADSVKIPSDVFGIRDTVAFGAINYLAFGRIRPAMNSYTASDLKKIAGEVNGIFWGVQLYNYHRITIPEAFFMVSGEDLYDENLYNLRTEQEDADDVTPDQRKYGFWDYIDDGSSDHYMSPSKDEDIYAFVRMICSHTTEEMNALMASYPKLEDKYQILTSYISEIYGVDLQAIGDHTFEE